MSHTILDQLQAHRIVPVLVLDDAAVAPDLGSALSAGGLPCAEVTFRTPAALEAIRAMASQTDCLVGAGTVVRPAQVEAALGAGARFVVSPGLSVEVVRECQRLDVPVIPGIATASELQLAAALGLSAVKLFPANIAGGPAAIAALAGPFPGMRFMPTGGVNATNLADYLALPQVLAVGGTWMVPAGQISAGAWDDIQQLVVDAVAAADTIRPRKATTS